MDHIFFVPKYDGLSINYYDAAYKQFSHASKFLDEYIIGKLTEIIHLRRPKIVLVNARTMECFPVEMNVENEEQYPFSFSQSPLDAMNSWNDAYLAGSCPIFFAASQTPDMMFICNPNEDEWSIFDGGECLCYLKPCEWFEISTSKLFDEQSFLDDNAKDAIIIPFDMPLFEIRKQIVLKKDNTIWVEDAVLVLEKGIYYSPEEIVYALNQSNSCKGERNGNLFVISLSKKGCLVITAHHRKIPPSSVSFFCLNEFMGFLPDKEYVLPFRTNAVVRGHHPCEWHQFHKM